MVSSGSRWQSFSGSLLPCERQAVIVGSEELVQRQPFEHESDHSTVKKTEHRTEGRMKRSTTRSTTPGSPLVGLFLPPSVPWHASLDPVLQKQVRDVLVVLADRLADPEHVLAHIQSQPESHWSATSLFSGLPGLALFFFFLARATREQQWFALARRYLALAGEATQQQPLATPRAIGQFLLALFCFEQGEQGETSLRKARCSLETSLAKLAVDEQWMKQAHQAHRTPPAYDTMGMSGLLGALISPAQRDDGLTLKALGAYIQQLVAFVAPLDPQRETRWAVPASYFPAQEKRYHDALIVNCGLAHGLPGPLAALSLAHLSGWNVPHQQEAIRCLTSWLLTHRLTMPWGIDWPAVIPLGLPLSEVQALPPARTAWCYGTPGVARACWLAGHALGDVVVQETALTAMEAVLRRPTDTRQIDSCSLCHGKAGLLLLAVLFFQETHRPCFREPIDLLARQILHDFHPESPFGFRFPLSPGQEVDAVGLLLGVTGTALALLAASSEVEPQWVRAFLLA